MEINSLNDLAAFIESVKQGSFTLAAKQMGLTRSTIGKRIARLEERLNTRLLNRNTRNLSLTDEGRVFFERCGAVLDELESAEQCLAQHTQTPSGKLRISAPVGLGRLAVSPIILKYMEEYPQVSVDLSMSDRYVDLVEEGFDVALRVGIPNPDSGLLARTVGGQRILTCASPQYLSRYGEPATPADLATHQCLHFMHNGRASPWHFVRNGKTESFCGSARFCADNGEALVPAAKAGYGIAQFPHYLIEPAIKAGDLVPVLTAFRTPDVPIQAVYPSRRQLSPKVRSFIDTLVEEWNV